MRYFKKDCDKFQYDFQNQRSFSDKIAHFSRKQLSRSEKEKKGKSHFNMVLYRRFYSLDNDDVITKNVNDNKLS